MNDTCKLILADICLTDMLHLIYHVSY